MDIAMSTIANVTTAEQLYAANMPHCELIGGELVMMSPAGFDHGRFASRIVAALENYVSGRSLGIVTTAEAGFQLAHDPDTVRAPDVAFVRADRVPAGGVKGYFQGAPDLAVEVVSPSDRPDGVAAKGQDWLQAGCAAVWIVNPHDRTVCIRQRGEREVILSANDMLGGGNILPGFSMPVAKIFATMPC
jgi:Uma2 family endonuclease